MSEGRRRLHLNAFLMEAGHHEASWRLADSNPRADFDLGHPESFLASLKDQADLAPNPA